MRLTLEANSSKREVVTFGYDVISLKKVREVVYT